MTTKKRKRLYHFTVTREYEGYWYGDRPPNDGDVSGLLGQGEVVVEYVDAYEITQPPLPGDARDLVFGEVGDADITVGGAFKETQQ